MTEKTDKAISGFEDLVVFNKAYQLSLEIHRMARTLPGEEQYELARQIRRASKGICANIAEGYGKQSVSKAEFKRFLLMAMRSADGMRVWLRYSVDLGYIEHAECQRWRAAYRDIARMLNGLHRQWA